MDAGKSEGTPIRDVMVALTSMQNTYQYEAVFLTDKDGKTIASTETGSYDPGSLPLRQVALQLAINEKRNIISDVLISKIHTKPTVFFFAPVFSSEKADLIGILGILLDPTASLYPSFTQSKYLGETGEILLVNDIGVVQSPLKYREKAIATMRIHAEPAERGASGEIGITAINDYRPEPVMAAYGYVSEFDWGIVVKQDIAEINVPVSTMAQHVMVVSFGVSIITLIFGVIIARRISRPALNIAQTAALISKGNPDIRIPLAGPVEIQQIALSINDMVEQLSSQVHVSRVIADVFSAAVKHNRLADLFDEILPLLMEITGSQFGVVYLTDSTGNTMDRLLMHGLDSEFVTKQITINPPDNLLTENLVSGKIQVFTDIPGGNELLINTQAGKAAPHALLSIPLTLRNNHVGVIGLASVYNYDDAAQQVAEGIRTNLAQAVEICNSFEQSEEMSNELNSRNDELQTTSAEQAELLKELEVQRRQAAQADKLKSEFLSNMSHELRTPLNSVLSLSQLMLSDGIGAVGGEDKERLEIIERNGRHLLNLINDILDLSKIESGKMELNVSTFKAAEPVDAVVAAIRPMAEEKGVGITTDIADMKKVQSDKDKFQQILLNLMSNAQKFTMKGEIGIRVRQNGDSIVCKIWDTGCGIPAKELPFIFDEFK